MLYPKSKQLKKNKKENPKKLPRETLQNFIDLIFKRAKGKCQLCTVKKIDEYHHSIFGSMGADRDDRSLMGICRECHYAIHHGRDGRGQKLRQEAIKIGAKNWSFFNEKTSK